MSDHGARPMMGGICFNDWLIENGYLDPEGAGITKLTPIADAPIDWGRTMAWGDGGYYGRLFLNVAGREPQGVIEPAAVRDRARRARRQARVDARAGRRAARHQGAQATGRLSGGPGRGAGSPRVLRRPRMAVGGRGREPERLHVRERHRPRRRQPRSDRCLRDEGRARPADRQGGGTQAWSTWARRSCRSSGSTPSTGASRSFL